MQMTIEQHDTVRRNMDLARALIFNWIYDLKRMPIEEVIDVEAIREARPYSEARLQEAGSL